MIFASQESIREWTGKGIWGKKTLVDYFKEQVAKTPDELGIVDPLNKEALVGLKPERLTFKEFDRAVDATGEALMAMGIKRMTSCWFKYPTAGNLPCFTLP